MEIVINSSIQNSKDQNLDDHPDLDHPIRPFDSPEYNDQQFDSQPLEEGCPPQANVIMEAAAEYEESPDINYMRQTGHFPQEYRDNYDGQPILVYNPTVAGSNEFDL